MIMKTEDKIPKGWVSALVTPEVKPIAPFLVSTTSLKLKIPSVVAPEAGKDYPVKKLTTVDDDGNEVLKKVKVPIIKHVTKTLSMPTSSGFKHLKESLLKGEIFIEDVFNDEMKKAGFKKPESWRSYGHENEFKMDMERDGKKFTCQVNAYPARVGRYDSTTKLLPYATHEHEMQSSYAHEPLGTRSIPTVYIPHVDIIADTIFENRMKFAPKDVVETCKKLVERAMSVSAVRVMNFPQNPITMDEYEDLRIKK